MLVRLMVMVEAEVILGLEMEKVVFPAKSAAGVTVMVALAEPVTNEAGTSIFIVAEFPAGRL